MASALKKKPANSYESGSQSARGGSPPTGTAGIKKSRFAFGQLAGNSMKSMRSGFNTFSTAFNNSIAADRPSTGRGFHSKAPRARTVTGPVGAPKFMSNLYAKRKSGGSSSSKKGSSKSSASSVMTTGASVPKRRRSLVFESAPKLPSNFYVPQSFVNLLYRITEVEMDSSTNNADFSTKESGFGLAILDIDNLRGHIRSPIAKAKPPAKKSATKKKTTTNLDNSKKRPDGGGGTNGPKSGVVRGHARRISQEITESVGIMDNETPAAVAAAVNIHRRQRSLLNMQVDLDDGSGGLGVARGRRDSIEEDAKSGDRSDEEEVEDEENDDDGDRGLKGGANGGYGSDSVSKSGTDLDEDDDDDDDDESDDGQSSLPGALPGGLEDEDREDHDGHRDSLTNGRSNRLSNGVNRGNGNGGGGSGGSGSENDDDGIIGSSNPQPLLHSISNTLGSGGSSAHSPIQGHGQTNLSSHMMFWNGSKTGESVVKVVQDIILMSISKDINLTHLGFGEFAILTSVANMSELKRITKRILTRVASNVATEMNGPVTLSAGISMYQNGITASAWIHRCREAVALAKSNGRGRVVEYLSMRKRKSLAIQLMLEIKKSPSDFSGARVLQLIRQGADLNGMYRHETPLMIAINRKCQLAIRHLVRHDYDPNLTDRHGNTPLMMGIQNGLDGILLDAMVGQNNLNPRIRNSAGETALTLALKAGLRDLSKTLILLGADPLLSEKVVIEQWFNACIQGDVQTIETMIDSLSFPIDMIDGDEMTALMRACEANQFQMVQWLVEKGGANIDIQGRRGYTATMIACLCGHLSIFNYLATERKSILTTMSDDLNSIIHCASHHDSMAHVIAMVDKSYLHAVLNSPNQIAGHTPLMIASLKRSPLVATQLLRQSAKLNLVSNDGMTALAIACQTGSARVASILITLGADMHLCRASDGKSPLIFASENGHTAIVTQLIKHDVDRSYTDLHGHDALHYAKGEAKAEIRSMIETGQLREMADLIGQIEILQQKNLSLQKTVRLLSDENGQLIDNVNRTELQRNQLQMKLKNTLLRFGKK